MLLDMRRLAVGFRTQVRTIRSLMLRDMLMRHGRDNIGFGWVILEPMILTAGVMIVWTIMAGGVDKGKGGINVVEMVLTGYMPLTLWRHMTNPSIMLFRRSVPLLYHRQITLFDILLSKLSLEFIGASAAFVFVWSSLYALGVVSGIYNLSLLIAGWLMMAFLGLAGGALIVAITERWEAAERFIQPSQYLMVPISGCFFLLDWLPTWAQDALLYNPMVHCFEVFRAGYFGSALTFHYEFGYFAVVAFVLLFFGVLAVHHIRQWVQIS